MFPQFPGGPGGYHIYAFNAVKMQRIAQKDPLNQLGFFELDLFFRHYVESKNHQHFHHARRVELTQKNGIQKRHVINTYTFPICYSCCCERSTFWCFFFLDPLGSLEFLHPRLRWRHGRCRTSEWLVPNGGSGRSRNLGLFGTSLGRWFWMDFVWQVHVIWEALMISNI